MSRTVSARIKPDMHEKLREQCNTIGCSINDFIEGCIELGLNGHSDFDFDDQNSTLMPNTAEKLKENHDSKKPVLHFHWEGDKLIQGETTWEEK